MKIHHNTKLTDVKIKLLNQRKFSDDYSFIPIQVIESKKRIPFLIQTPPLFIPYGITQNDDGTKSHINVSFHNKENDTFTQNLLKDLENIYQKIKYIYQDNFNVNPFLKETMYSECMKIKINERTIHYTSQKKQIDTIECFSYGSFIIHLSGIWIQGNQMWFHWILIQSRIEEKLEINEYLFTDKKIPPPPPLPKSFSSISKYHSMIKMGVPKQAVLQKMQQDKVDPKVLEKNETIVHNPSKNLITNSMLQSVTLKKRSKDLKVIEGNINKNIEKRINKRDDPRVPSLQDIQGALKKLKKVGES